MVFRPGRLDVAPLATVLAGLGVAIELERRFPGLHPLLKWPNDLIARERKLGGILVEQSRDGRGTSQLVVGVGINLDIDLLPDAVSSRAVGVSQCVNADLAAIADAAVHGLGRWMTDIPETLDEATLVELDRLDWLKGRRLAWTSSGAEPVRGTGAGIAPDGALLIRPDRGALRRVITGSIEPEGGRE
jgi:BirA family biotin operon repressor/biotin-[acetyl-CoA-carboxylase] ligase